MDKQHKKTENDVGESSQTVNDGVGPISNEFLESILLNGVDGGMSRAELSRKRHRLNTILTASPEQLKGMGIEVSELEQILDFCDSRFTLAFSEMDQHLSKVESFIASNIFNPSLASYEVLMKKVAPLWDAAASKMHPDLQVARLGECEARLKRLALQADLEIDDVVELVQILKECNNISKTVSDETEELGALIEDMNI